MLRPHDWYADSHVDSSIHHDLHAPVRAVTTVASRRGVARSQCCNLRHPRLLAELSAVRSVTTTASCSSATAGEPCIDNPHLSALLLLVASLHTV
jgi:hypothetical protein